MSVTLVIDMNLSEEWIPFLATGGWDAIHWSNVGDPRAEDADVMAWALAAGRVVFTHDLDFGTMLALSHAGGPSVLQVRGRAVLPEDVGLQIVAALRQYQSELARGCLVVVEVGRSRVRVLPI